MTPTELGDYLRDTLGEKVTDAKVAYGQLTVTVEPDALPDVARACKEDSALWFDFFDFMAGVDEREAGFSVVTHLYSISHRHHITLRSLAPGGREAPRLPTLTGVYRGADWYEREAYDMFGIEFTGHPGLLPRILTVENFEGFPLRKDFLLTSREAKPWPGAKEPEERKEHGEAPAAGTTGSVPITGEDKAAAAKAKAERAKAKAAEMRKQKAAERAAGAGLSPPTEPEAVTLPEDEPFGAAEIAGTAIAKDAAAGAVQGDVAAGAPGDLPGEDQPVEDPAAEAATAQGAPATPSGTPGVEAEGRHGGAGPQGAGGTPPIPQGAGGSPPTEQGAGESPPTEQGGDQDEHGDRT
ncbi:MAG: NADH-quinone oxidoreductase subunit C [Egibacteraceae bacterium]